MVGFTTRVGVPPLACFVSSVACIELSSQRTEAPRQVCSWLPVRGVGLPQSKGLYGKAPILLCCTERGLKRGEKADDGGVRDVSALTGGTHFEVTIHTSNRPLKASMEDCGVIYGDKMSLMVSLVSCASMNWYGQYANQTRANILAWWIIGSWQSCHAQYKEKCNLSTQRLEVVLKHGCSNAFSQNSARCDVMTSSIAGSTNTVASARAV